MPLCNLCPRLCNAQRTPQSGLGYCRMGTLPVVARAAAHFWEEPCLSGTRGSGAVFFSGCSLGCVFCQNDPVSHGGLGRRLTVPQLAALFRDVEGLGVHNLNLVTPTHFAPAIFEALALYKPRVPVVWNSGGYERPQTARAAKGLVDIFLPDFKYADERTARELAQAPDYFDTALAAIRAMREVSGPAQYDADGLMTRGTLVRHLVLPLRVNESVRILETLHRELPDVPVSLMRQYTPMNGVAVKGLDRRVTAREYARARDCMLDLGISGYIQGREAASSAFTPAFMDEESARLFPPT